jgi:hypothetical protein
MPSCDGSCYPRKIGGVYTQQMPWTGGWRWFRSANIVCIEHWRRKKAQGKRTQAGGCGRAG